MIFKLTFKDNDFTQYLENMCEKNKVNLLWHIPKPDNFEQLSVEEQVSHYIKDSQFRDWCNVNSMDSSKLTKEETKLLEERVKLNTLAYLKKYHQRDYWYLKENLRVKFVKTFKHIWENGECVYYFPFNGGKWLSQ